MKEILDYLGKVIAVLYIAYLLVSCVAAVMPDTTPSHPSYSNSYKSSYTGSTRRSTPTPTPRPANTTKTNTKATTKSSSGSTKKSSSSYRDIDDYDVDGFYYDNRYDFEDEDDAWDYLEDEPDDWD